MTAAWRALLACLLALAACTAWGQYKGPAVETCRNYAERDLRRDNANVEALIFDSDQNMVIERYTRKLGSQFVSSVLSGNGALVYRRAPAIEFAFICLLADERRAVFFSWVPRKDWSALRRCTRAAGITPARCLDDLLQIAEQDLAQLYAEQLVDVRQADAAAKNDQATATFRRSGEAWLAYRDAECRRRGGAEAQKACMVELTTRRTLDLRRPEAR